MCYNVFVSHTLTRLERIAALFVAMATDKQGLPRKPFVVLPTRYISTGRLRHLNGEGLVAVV